MRRPPEKLLKDAGDTFQVGLSSDIWSLGVLLLQLACCNPWLPYGPGVDLSNVAAQVGPVPHLDLGVSELAFLCTAF